LVINKTDGLDVDHAAAEFHRLGFRQWFGIAATHRRGLKCLMEATLADMSAFDKETDSLTSSGICVAILGRPNVGKSTLINRLLGEERVLAHDMPGTTRDSIFVPFSYHGQSYTLIDTAGVRRRARVTVALEQMAVAKSLRAIYAAHVVIIVIDAHENISEQDLKLLGLTLQAGRAVIIAVNKWDGLSNYQRQQVKAALERRLSFVSFAKCHFISALHGTGVGDLLSFAKHCYQAASKEWPTSRLTGILEDAVKAHQPPLEKGRRIKLRYAHLGGHHPLTIVIHGKQVSKLAHSYCRYLENYYRRALKLNSIPIKLRFKSGDNPFIASHDV